ncbi:MAG: tRNA pseudouridine(38-40) synthase TruA [Anaerolineaceae bacterium]|nr:tRNA pseudouridine(38-40) synthase TruA [Anaerolineaceae bacterium]MDD4043733.1 tRNA pseudouridine(38-40) synthase TruA [Anaerolineaceae bacterium]MDD4578706.1 tRNA pseudouridine(38-40) synthase TruA [Anaerolineaceae bacterium]
MAHYKLILAYEGTQYSGFQRQLEKPSVQGVFEDALRQLGWQGISILTAGRTDTGVHASGQVVSFEFDWKHDDNKLLKALNAHLPADIQVQRLEQTGAQFHPRYDALARTYRYRLYWQPARDPLRDRFAWRLDSAPDIDMMNEASQYLLGEHNFIAFGRPLSENGTSIRRIEQARWQLTGADSMEFTITGNAFLYHMVRRIVYMLVKVGLKEAPAEIVLQGLQTGTTGIVALAPARGLTMMEVRFAEDMEK